MQPHTYIERQVVEAVCKGLIDAGFLITVNNGEEDVIEKSTDVPAIMAAIQSSDWDFLLVFKPGETQYFGSVNLVYGNDGYDVVSDYSINLEEPVGRISTEWYDRFTKG